jgi:hypothetical protein
MRAIDLAIRFFLDVRRFYAANSSKANLCGGSNRVVHRGTSAML